MMVVSGVVGEVVASPYFLGSVCLGLFGGFICCLAGFFGFFGCGFATE